MAITIDDFSKIWASTSPLTPYAFSENNYKEGWNFIGGTPPSRQMWDFLQKQNDEKLKYLLDNFNDYLPLSGGTMTGAIAVSNNTVLAKKDVTDSYILVEGGTSATTGAYISLAGKDNTDGGAFGIAAHNGSVYKSLVGKPDGTLTWDGKSLSNVPDLGVFLDTSDFGGVTAFNNRVTNIVGGYKQIGNIVYVSVRFKPATLNGVGIWNLMIGFPQPSQTVALPFCAELSDADSIKFVWAMISGASGYLSMALNASLTADADASHTVLVNGFYLAAQ